MTSEQNPAGGVAVRVEAKVVLDAADLRRCGCEERATCQRCGGSGWRRKCLNRDCAEYGCNYGRHCFVSHADGGRLDRMQNAELIGVAADGEIHGE